MLMVPFIDDDDLKVKFFSGLKVSFLFLESISNFVSNLFLYILKYFQFLLNNNSILTSFIVKTAFLVGKEITCFVTDIIIES